MGLAVSGVVYLGDKHLVEPDRGDGLHNTVNALKMKVKSLSRVQLFVTPMNCSLPGFSIHGIFQARVLE